MNPWNSVTVRKCPMLIANLNRIPVENLSSMITTDFFFNILGSKTPVSEVSDLLFFSLFIFSFRIPLEWIINKLIKFRSRIFDKRSLNMGRLTILYSFVGENRIIFYISLKKKTIFLIQIWLRINFIHLGTFQL